MYSAVRDAVPATCWLKRVDTHLLGGRTAAALRCIRQAWRVSHAPEIALVVLGHLMDLDHLVDARRVADEFQPGNCSHAQLSGVLGDLYLATDLPAQAVAWYLRASALRPTWHIPAMNRGIALLQMGDYASALSAFAQALSLAPRDAAVLLNSGTAHLQAGHATLALNELLRARYTLGFTPAICGLIGKALCDAGRHATARRHALHAMRLHRHHPQLRFDFGLLLLRLNRPARGWKFYQCRFLTNETPARSYGLPEWRGRRGIRPGRWLIYGEQGVGDQIFFARWLPALLAMNPACVLECDPRLVSIFRASFPQLVVYGFGETPAGQMATREAAIALGSLPEVTGLAHPAVAPYLRPATATHSAINREHSNGLHIGVVWRGGLLAHRQQVRSIPLHLLQHLFEIPGLHVHVLQHDVSNAETAWLAEQLPGRVHLTHATQPDFNSLAALCLNLRVVICVEGSMAHLGGAIGATTWVCTPAAPGWRYDRFTPSWYPSQQLFRQPRAGDWISVVSQLRSALTNLRQPSPCSSSC